MKNIIMNTWMTKAILDSRKTQTRRAIKRFYDLSLKEPKKHPLSFKDMPKDLEFKEFQGHEDICPLFYSKSLDKYYCGDNIKYKISEKIWVREPAKIDMCFTEEIHFHYLSDNTASKIDIPKRFIQDGFITDWMAHCHGVPNGCIKEMARIFLKITDVHVERLHDITVGDMINEGVSINNLDGLIREGMVTLSKTSIEDLTAVEIAIKNSFIKIWNKTAKDSYKWEDNPSVFVCEFERVNKDGSKYE